MKTLLVLLMVAMCSVVAQADGLLSVIPVIAGVGLEQADPCYVLTTVVGPNGSLIVEPNQAYYPDGTVVTLTAVPDEDYEVASWFGTDNDMPEDPLTTTVTMSTDRVVTLDFQLRTVTLTVNVEGNGVVIPDGGTFTINEIVTLAAIPDADHMLDSWEGTVEDTSRDLINTVFMDDDKTVTVTFEAIPTYTIEIDDIKVYPGLPDGIGTFVVRGELPSSRGLMETASSVHLEFGPYADDFGLVDFRVIGSTYLHLNNPILLINQHDQSFMFIGRGLKLTGLQNPVSMKVDFGNYRSEVEETVENLSYAFIRGIADDLNADSARILYSGFLHVTGRIALADPDVDFQDNNVILTWGSQEFFLPKGQFTRFGTLDRYIDATGAYGDVYLLHVNLQISTFAALIRTDNLNQTSGTVTFGLQFADFDQSDSVAVETP